MRRAWPIAAALLITCYGALLRLDGFVARYGTLDHPRWAAVLTHDVAPLGARLRPFDVGWARVDEPYVGGDSINYLRFAREMRSFYQAHVREPVFLALTRGFLWLLAGQDAAVSFASAAGSILTILAIYLLAAAFLPPLAALGAALLVAIEYEFITWAVDGWRDDTFTATVVLTAWAFVRIARAPTFGNALLLGGCAAAACLTRITALSFIVPAFCWLALDRPGSLRRERVRYGGLALVMTIVLVAPFLVNCWIATGDPFFAINYHTVYYRAGEGLPTDAPMSAADYLSDKFARRPLATLDTGVLGLFIEPFTSKWRGLYPSLGALTEGVKWAAAAGLLLLPKAAPGRALLIVLFTSLLPYAFTWNIGAGNEWRFTMHAYPFYIVAAMFVAAQAWRLADAARAGGTAVLLRPSRRALLWTGAATLVVALLAGAYFVLPWFVVREAIAAGDDTSVETGSRDRVFFGDGWTRPRHEGITARVSTGERSHIRIPLPSQRAYDVVLRLDPAMLDGQRRLDVLFNGRFVARFSYTFDPNRVGSYRFRLEPEYVRAGSNDLVLVPDARVAAGTAGERFAWIDPGTRIGVRLWYVRVLGRAEQRTRQ